MEPILLQHLLNNWSDLSRREAQIVGYRTLNLLSATRDTVHPAPQNLAETKQLSIKHRKSDNPT
jgi:hypothetical protein